jgi:uncharacterized protein YxjI
MQPRFLVQQQITVLTNRYEIREAISTQETGGLLALAEQAKMKIREKISFYSDASKTHVQFSIRAEKVMDIHGRYFVEDAAGDLIGAFKKDFQKSLFQSTWLVLDTHDRVVLKIEEESVPLAILRRVGDMIPFVGEFIKFFPYHFAIIDAASGEKVGRYQKTTVIRDRYVFSMADEAWAAVDQRVMMAIAVALDALQSR